MLDDLTPFEEPLYVFPETPLEAWQKVWDHFSQPGATRSTLEGTCQYRGADGAKCAVGVLIPDEVYDEDLMDQGTFKGKVHAFVPNLLTLCDLKILAFKHPETYRLARRMQEAHDDHMQMETVLEKLQTLKPMETSHA